ncbi:unnamed protein product, partial [Staurois parvus]
MEPDAAKEAMPHPKTRKSPLGPWNSNGFMGVFFNREEGVPISKLLNIRPLQSSAGSVNAPNGASEQETNLGWKQTQNLQDKLPAVDGHLNTTSPSVFEDDFDHARHEIPQENQGIITAAKVLSPKVTSPKPAKQRLPGADEGKKTLSDNQPEKRNTSHDPLDDLYKLAITSPKIHIPRKESAPEVSLRKENCPKQENQSKQEEKIALSEWFVKGIENKGVFVEGKRVDCEDLYWHSNIITHRIDSHKVKTLTGRVYELQGNPDTACMLQAGCPSWLVEKFQLGFPDNWKSYVNSFLEFK